MADGLQNLAYPDYALTDKTPNFKLRNKLKYILHLKAQSCVISYQQLQREN